MLDGLINQAEGSSSFIPLPQVNMKVERAAIFFMGQREDSMATRLYVMSLDHGLFGT